MGIEPPFVYSSPSHYSFNGPTDRGFNPRAATQASWTPPAPKIKKDGPLIEFNRHPDSYLIVPYGHLNATPMPRSTRKTVVRFRQVQLALRFLQLIGSCGMLFCVIAINKTSSSVGWIIRLAPAVALLHTFYGFYHFCRAATGRTAGSSASYMVFAAMVDTGLIPFFVFCAMMSHADYSRNAYGWSTLFSTSETSYKIIYAFFLISITVGSLLVVSLMLGVYLALIFRKIAKLPPDMNPLEPNLTARPHKRNKSELTSEKHLSDTTDGSTNNMIAGTRRVPFMHTRTDSADSVTLYNASPRQSRLDLGKEEMYRHSNLSAISGISRPASAVSPSPNARFAGAGLEQDRKSERASKASSWLSYLDFEGVPTPLSEEAEHYLDGEVEPPAPSRSPSPKPQRDSKNWFTRSARNSQISLPQAMTSSSARNSQVSLSEPMPNSSRPSMQEHRQNTYESPHANDSLVVPPLHPFPNKQRSREPLGMNPPSPLREAFHGDENISVHDQSNEQFNQSHSPATPRPALQESNGNTARPQQTSRPSSFVGTGGKARFYGDLRSSIGSINKYDEPRKDDVSSISDSDYSRTRTLESEISANFQIHHENVSDEEDEGNYVTYNAVPTQHNWNGPRQVSNSTGYNLNSGYAGLGAEFGQGMGRRREVSGKVAEEGRGDGAYYGRSESPSKAAGWARFKGL